MCQEGAVVPLDVAMMVCCQLCAASIVKGIGTARDAKESHPTTGQSVFVDLCFVLTGPMLFFHIVLCARGNPVVQSVRAFVSGPIAFAVASCHLVVRAVSFSVGFNSRENVACDTCGGASSGALMRWVFLCVASMQRRTLFCRRFRETCSSAFLLHF